MGSKNFYNSWSLAPWFQGIRLVDFRDKTAALQTKVRYMLARTNRMFEVKGLPESMPESVIKTMIQTNGHIGVVTPNGEMYGVAGTFSGEPSPYYRGTRYVTANPALPGLKTEYTIGEDCVIVRNDHLSIGLLPMINTYASMLIENELSIVNELVNSRAAFLIGAGCDADKLAADDYIRSLWAGDLKSVLENRFVDGIKVNPGAAASDRLTQLIEANQFITAKMFNELGLDANYNMKRESLTANEVDMNSDSLMPLVDDMLTSWREGFEDVNEMCGTSITVELTSSWKDNEQQIHVDPDEPAATEEEKNEDVKID